MTRPVYLHIGVPKTGTTFVQEVLWNNVDRLRALGYDLAADAYVKHTRAIRDLTDPTSSRRAWDRQAARVVASPAPVVLSQEHVSRARPDQIARAIGSLAPRPVTVIITARDLARQIASHWQQQVKQRYAGTLAERVAVITSRGEDELDFWWQQDLLALVDRWLAQVPVERIVVVTNPPAGSDPAVLWQRFASACDLDPGGFDLDVRTPNESLGVAQVELLRRFNAALGDRLVEGYQGLVRRFVANELLAGQPAYQRFGVDAPTHAWATEHGIATADGLQARGVRVVGDLADLVPGPYVELVDPGHVDERSVADAATDLLVDLVVHWHEEGRDLPQRPTGTLRHGGARRRESAGDSQTR